MKNIDLFKIIFFIGITQALAVGSRARRGRGGCDEPSATEEHRLREELHGARSPGHRGARHPLDAQPGGGAQREGDGGPGAGTSMIFINSVYTISMLVLLLHNLLGN